jgi:hypothetical protein
MSFVILSVRLNNLNNAFFFQKNIFSLGFSDSQGVNPIIVHYSGINSNLELMFRRKTSNTIGPMNWATRLLQLEAQYRRKQSKQKQPQKFRRNKKKRRYTLRYYMENNEKPAYLIDYRSLLYLYLRRGRRRVFFRKRRLKQRYYLLKWRHILLLALQGGKKLFEWIKYYGRWYYVENIKMLKFGFYIFKLENGFFKRWFGINKGRRKYFSRIVDHRLPIRFGIFKKMKYRLKKNQNQSVRRYLSFLSKMTNLIKLSYNFLDYRIATKMRREKKKKKIFFFRRFYENQNKDNSRDAASRYRKHRFQQKKSGYLMPIFFRQKKKRKGRKLLKKWYMAKQYKKWNLFRYLLISDQVKRKTRQIVIYKQYFQNYFQINFTSSFLKSLFLYHQRYRHLDGNNFERFTWFFFMRVIFFLPNIPFVTFFRVRHSYWLLLRLIQFGIVIINGILIYQPFALLRKFDFFTLLYAFFWHTYYDNNLTKAIIKNETFFFRNIIEKRIKIYFKMISRFFKKIKFLKRNSNFFLYYYETLIFLFLSRFKQLLNKKNWKKIKKKKRKIHYFFVRKYLKFQQLYIFRQVLKVLLYIKSAIRSFRKFNRTLVINTKLHRFVPVKTIFKKRKQLFKKVKLLKSQATPVWHLQFLKNKYNFLFRQAYLVWKHKYWLYVNQNILSMLILDINYGFGGDFHILSPKISIAKFFIWMSSVMI